MLNELLKAPLHAQTSTTGLVWYWRKRSSVFSTWTYESLCFCLLYTHHRHQVLFYSVYHVEPPCLYSSPEWTNQTLSPYFLLYIWKGRMRRGGCHYLLNRMTYCPIKLAKFRFKSGTFQSKKFVGTRLWVWRDISVLCSFQYFQYRLGRKGEGVAVQPV